MATCERLVDVKGPMKYVVASTAFDPDSRTFFYTADNVAFRDLMALDLGTGKARMLLRTRASATWPSTARTARCTASATRTATRPWYGWRRRTRTGTQMLTLPYGQVLTDLDVSPDGKLLSVTHGGGRRPAVPARVSHRRLRAPAPRKRRPLSQFDFGQAVPEGFVFTPDGNATCTAVPTTPACRTCTATTIASGKMDALTNAETGFFRPIPMADGAPDRARVLRHRLRADPARRRSRSRTWARSPSWATRSPTRAPGHPTWNAGSPAAVRSTAWCARATTTCRASRCATTAAIRSCRAIATAWRSAGASTSPTRCTCTTSASAPAIRSTTACRPTRSCTCAWTTARSTGTPPLWHNNADFYDLSGPIKRSRKGDALALGYRKLLVYDEPRRIEWRRGRRLLHRPGHPAGQPERAPARSTRCSAPRSASTTATRASRRPASTTRRASTLDRVAVGRPRRRRDRSRSTTAASTSASRCRWRNSSIWLYNAAGVAGGDENDSLGHFYFGGFHNNYLDKGAVKRYREYDTFPGLEIDALPARAS